MTSPAQQDVPIFIRRYGHVPRQKPAEKPAEVSKDEKSKNEKLFGLVVDLMQLDKREAALNALRACREDHPNLATVLWHSAGAIAALLQEIVRVYPSLNPPSLTHDQSTRVCNALALFQCIASCPDTRSEFLQAHIPLFLYPFLNTSTKSKEFDYLRLTSLGVIGALVKSDDVETIRFLLSTEIIPLCLRIMQSGTELSKTVATFVMQKIVYFDIGLGYICASPDRFYAVSNVLSQMVSGIESPRLLKSIVRCYLRLSDHPQARSVLASCCPVEIRDNTIEHLCDYTMKRQRVLLLMNLGIFQNYNTGIQ